MVNLGRSAFPSEGVRMHVRVGCDQSPVGTWTAKRPAHSLVASVAEFDGVGGYSLPPCGEGLGWGIARHSQIKGLFFKRIQRRPRRPIAQGAPAASVLSVNSEWCVDFKGWFRTRDGFDLLTVTDISAGGTDSPGPTMKRSDLFFERLFFRASRRGPLRQTRAPRKRRHRKSPRFQATMNSDAPPSRTLPHEGGGDPLRPIKFTDATD